jgi:hypothetical protein
MIHHDRKTWALSIATLVVGLATGMTPALAQEGSGVFMKDVLGKLGIIDEEAPTIEYKERAPLVIPPKLNLPAPGTVGAARPANWPKDPDVAAAQRAREEANRPAKVRNDHDGATVLSVDELRKGRRPGAQVVNTPDPDRCTGDNCRLYLSPDFLRNNGRIGPEKSSIAYGQEPERSTLADPPKGYRMPSANAPLGDGRGSPIMREDEADTHKFIRQQAGQN